MGRKSQFSKEIKIQACRDDEKGKLSFKNISKEIGVNKETVRLWYLSYKEHGPNIFETSTKNRSYSKEFKLAVIEEYTSSKYSLPDLTAKYNISTSVIRKWVIDNNMSYKDAADKYGVTYALVYK